MDRAILKRVEKQAWFHKYPRGLPTLLFLLTCLVTLLAVIAVERADARARRLELASNTTELAASLEQLAAENIAYLSAAASVFSSTDQVSAISFANFANELNYRHEDRGSLGIGWAKLLRPADVRSFERQIHEEGFSSYNVHPQPRRDSGASVPIVYLQPATRPNRDAIGYDMYSEDVRRAAINRAVQTGRPAVSGKVHLVQDEGSDNQYGFLIYVPVIEYRYGRDTVTGFVYSPIRAREFLASSVSLIANSSIEATIYDEVKSQESILAERFIAGETSTEFDQRIEIGDRTWILSVADKKPQSLSLISKLVLLFGLIAATMLTAIARLITKRAAEDRLVLEWLSKQTAIRNSLTRELNHRVKNTLANVLSIVSLTRRRTDNIDDFADGLSGRIRALSATHDLLSQSDWNDAAVEEIVSSEIAPYIQEHENHIVTNGPFVRLSPNDALSLGLAIHELVTNAAKYGALSTPDGRVDIDWAYQDDETLEFNWRESGGPPVSEPRHRGFGLELLERVVAHELKTKVEIQFDPAGLKCTLRVPIRARSEFELRKGS